MSGSVSRIPNSLLSDAADDCTRVVELRELLHRLEELGEEQHGGDDDADLDLASGVQPTADADDDRRCEHPGRFDETEVPGRHLHAVDVRVVELPVRLLEAAALLGLTGVGLDDPDPGDPFLQRGEVLADVLANIEVGSVGVTLELARRHDDDRHHEQPDERELP